MTNLNTKAWLSLAALAVVMGILLFVPAWTVHYWQAWVYLSIFTGTSALTTLYLMRHDRALLERRMRGGPTAEKQPAQRLTMLCTSIGFIALLVVPALDFRFAWSAVPRGGVVGRRYSCRDRFLFHFPRVSREHILGRNHRSRGGSEGHFYRAVCNRPPPDVRKRVAVPLWDAAGAWLVLGARRTRGYGALSALEAL